MPSKIILMEDDEDIAWLVKIRLEKAGYNVHVSNNGLMGLGEFMSSGADLVVLDVKMPGLNGWEVYSRIRETSQVPVIMLSAFEREHNQDDISELQADCYLSKPFIVKDLLAKIETLLSHNASLCRSNEETYSALRSNSI